MKNLFLVLLFLIQSCTPAFAGTESILKIDQADGLESAKNYMKEKAHFEKSANGWVAYADAAQRLPVDGTGGAPTVTCTRSTTTPITGDGSLILTKTAVNSQGQGCSATFTVDNAAKTKVMQIELDYRVVSGTFVAGSDTTDSDLILYMYDVTNSTLIEPSSIKFLTNSTTNPSKMIANFQTSATGTTYNLILHAATTSAAAYVVMFDNVKVMQSRYVYGTPITDWQSYTPTVTQGFGSVGSVNLQSRRVGDTLQVRGRWTNGTVNTSEARLSLGYGGVSGNVTIDASKIISTQPVGSYLRNLADTSVVTYYVLAQTGGLNYVNFSRQTSAATPITLATGAEIADSTTGVSAVQFEVPITGWSSNVQMSDGFNTAEISFIANTSTTAASASTPFIYTTVVSNKGGGYNVANGKFTAPTQGTYFFRATMYTGATLPEPVCYLNGVSYNRGSAQPSAATPGGVSCVAVMNASDTMEIRPNGAATASGDLTLNNFSGFRIGSAQTMSADVVVAAVYTGIPTGTLANAFNTMTFGTKVTDTHNAYSGGTYTVPATGFYSISAQSTQSATYIAGGAAATSIAINGTQTYTGIEIGGFAGTYTLSPLVSVQAVPLIAGQLVTVQSLNNGTTPSFTSPLAGSNWFSIVKNK